MKVLACFLVLLLIIAGPVLLFRSAKLSTIHAERFTVERKGNREVQNNPDGTQNAYANLIYTDKGVFDNTDSTFPWKTRSSDVYNQLEAGKTYTCTIAGWRNGWMSWYKNIITCEGFKYE